MEKGGEGKGGEGDKRVSCAVAGGRESKGRWEGT